MVSWVPMNTKPEHGGRVIHGVRLTEAERATLRRIAGELECTRPDGGPSISRLLIEIADGALKVRRSRPTRASSQAERIRAAIAANPDAQNREIAAWLGLEGRTGLVNVASERRRLRLRAEAKEGKP